MTPSKLRIGGLFLFLLLIRLYDLNAPIVDFHSWNQISAASMAKHLYLDWNTLWAPEVDVYHSVKNQSRVYAQEFLLYHIPIAWLYELTGVSEWPARMVSIAYGLLGLWFWFLLIRRVSTENLALLATFLAGVCSLNWFYQRAVMSDTSMVTAMLGGLYYFYLWLEDPQKRRFLFYSGLWTAAAGLFKPFALMIGGSYLALIAFRKQWNVFKEWPLYLFGIGVWIPTILWIRHVLGIQEGITEFTDSNSMNQMKHWYLLISGAFYERVFLSRFIDLLLTPWMSVFAIYAFWKSRPSSNPAYQLALTWLAGNLIYLVVIQRGNFVHDYYQLPFVPGLTLVAAIGVYTVWNRIHENKRIQKSLVLLALVLFTVHSAKYAHNRFRANTGSYLVGKQIAELSQDPQDTVVAFDVGSDKKNQMIYYSGRYGWHLGGANMQMLNDFQEAGARWLGVNVSITPSHEKKYYPFLDEMDQRYTKVWEDLTQTDRYDRPVILRVYDLSPL